MVSRLLLLGIFGNFAVVGVDPAIMGVGPTYDILAARTSSGPRQVFVVITDIRCSQVFVALCLMPIVETSLVT